MDCSVQALTTNSTSISCCIRGRRQINAVKVWLLATIANVSNDPTFLRDQAKCFSNCTSATTLLGFDVFLLTLIAGGTQDPQTLANNARCFRQPCIHGSLREAIQVWILTQMAGTTSDSTTLVNNAKCIMECIPTGELFAVETWLLAQLAGSTTNPTALAASSACFNCLNPDELDAIYTNLLCNLPWGPGVIDNLLAWWKSDSLSLNNNDSVTSWPDSSGNGKTATQMTTQAVPVFLTNQVNGLPGLDFTNSRLVLNGPAGGAAPGSVDLLADHTLMAVYKQNAANDGVIIGNQSVNRQYRINNGQTRKNTFYNGVHVSASDAFTTAQTDVTCSVWRRADTTIFFRENKTDRNSDPVAGGTMSLNIIRDGSFGVPYNGLIFELLIYGRSLSDNEMNTLYDRYLKRRWLLP